MVKEELLKIEGGGFGVQEIGASEKKRRNVTHLPNEMPDITFPRIHSASKI